MCFPAYSAFHFYRVLTVFIQAHPRAPSSFKSKQIYRSSNLYDEVTIQDGRFMHALRLNYFLTIIFADFFYQSLFQSIKLLKTVLLLWLTRCHGPVRCEHWLNPSLTKAPKPTHPNTPNGMHYCISSLPSRPCAGLPSFHSLLHNQRLVMGEKGLEIRS